MLQNRVRVQFSGIVKKPMELYMFLECGVSVLGSQFSEINTFLTQKYTFSEHVFKFIGNYSVFRQRSWHPGICSVFRALAPTSVRQIWKILYFSVRNRYEIARIAAYFEFF